MSKSPPRKKPSLAPPPPTFVTLPPSEKASAPLTPLNFRVPEGFHREFKVYAAQRGMSMVDLLQQAFTCYRKRRGN